MWMIPTAIRLVLAKKHCTFQKSEHGGDICSHYSCTRTCACQGLEKRPDSKQSGHELMMPGCCSCSMFQIPRRCMRRSSHSSFNVLPFRYSYWGSWGKFLFLTKASFAPHLHTTLRVPKFLENKIRIEIYQISKGSSKIIKKNSTTKHLLSGAKEIIKQIKSLLCHLEDLIWGPQHPCEKQAWWCVPAIPALGRQRQMGLWDSPARQCSQSELQAQ